MAVTIEYEIFRNVEKKFVGEKFHGIKFKGQLIFKGLTVADRKSLGLPLEKIDIENPSSGEVNMIPITDEDTVEIVGHSEHIPPSVDSGFIRSTIIERMEKIKKRYEDKIAPEPAKETISLEIDDTIKTRLKNRTELEEEEERTRTR